MTYQELKIDTPTPVLSWAGHELAKAETKMAMNVASLPFVFKHVALMPDVHSRVHNANASIVFPVTCLLFITKIYSCCKGSN